eukprot:TRINITY_DN7078_c0_g1_i3.p2 TRINITY_DN7078_c0_g1~~TRINITY_DN7078_c0_g1_i3.p2  ORF type:complete len:109 (-),score=8.71 TRINITY_DN7078_c0_g1_i3:110-436(-)
MGKVIGRRNTMMQKTSHNTAMPWTSNLPVLLGLKGPGLNVSLFMISARGTKSPASHRHPGCVIFYLRDDEERDKYHNSNTAREPNCVHWTSELVQRLPQMMKWKATVT